MIKYVAFVIFITIATIIGFDFFNQNYTITAKIVNTPTPSPTPYVFSEEKLWNLIQDWKYEQDGYKYKEDENLCKFAKSRLNENFYKLDEHNGYLKRHKEIYAHGFIMMGENLASGYITEKITLNSWLSSPKHLKNLQFQYSHSCLKCETTHSFHKNVCVHIFASY